MGLDRSLVECAVIGPIWQQIRRAVALLGTRRQCCCSRAEGVYRGNCHARRRTAIESSGIQEPSDDAAVACVPNSIPGKQGAAYLAYSRSCV